MVVSPKAKVPTRSRVSIIHRLPHFSPRLMLGLGIIQMFSGIALVFLSLVMFRLDRDKALSWSISFHYLDNVLPEVLRIIWLGAWIATSAFITLLGTFRPTSGLLQIMLLLTSVVTIAITGAFAILISNHLIQNSLISSMFPRESQYMGDERDHHRTSHTPFFSAEEQYSGANPIIYFNVFMLCLCLFCTVSFVISIISFSIVSHHMCSCPSPFGNKMASHYQIYNTSTWSKKERIVQWVMQQSQLTDQPDLVLHRPDIVLPLGRKKLSALQSCASNSTKLSLYES